MTTEINTAINSSTLRRCLYVFVVVVVVESREVKAI